MIREAIQEDLDHIVKLYKYLNPEDDYSNLKDETWGEIVNNPMVTCLVLEVPKIVATATLVIVPNLTRGGRSYAIIENVITHPDFRGKGYGRLIMEEAIRVAKKSDCYKIMLQSSSKRVDAHGFYRSLGFDSHTKVGFHIRL